MSSLGSDLAYLVGRDLDALAAQLAAYPDSASVWRASGAVTNSAGTLTLHLVGNLRHYVGALLGGSGYVRRREEEFTARDVERDELVARVRECRAEVVPVLEGLGQEILDAPFPGELPPAFQGFSTRRFLLHLHGHLMWHRGQVDYHRKLLGAAAAG